MIFNDKQDKNHNHFITQTFVSKQILHIRRYFFVAGNNAFDKR